MYEILQIYWWVIVSLLGGLFVFMMFVQGGQTLALEVPNNELQRDMIINSIGRKWEITFTTLVMFGGACFAAFPLFYATSFGGAYWVWLAILFCFIIQAVSYEYRKKPHNFLGQRTYEVFLYINGSLGVLLIGIAVSTFFSGSDFALNEKNFVEWGSLARGLEALKNPYNWVLGIALVFLARTSGSIYFINNINDETLTAKFRKTALINGIIFVVLFVIFLIWTCLKDGYGYNEIGQMEMVHYKYLLNLIQVPVILAVLLIGVVLVLIGIVMASFTKSRQAIWFHGIGVILAVFAVFLDVGLNNTAFYPSFSNLASSLTIKNASSSYYTLQAMSWISILVPIVLIYIAYAWRSMDKVKITETEVKNSEELY